MPLNRKEPKANPGSDGNKEIISGISSASARKEDNLYAKIYHKDGTEVDLRKNSLPSSGKYEKVNIKALMFKCLNECQGSVLCLQSYVNTVLQASKEHICQQ